jgi:hypothetical protein
MFANEAYAEVAYAELVPYLVYILMAQIVW